MTEHLLQDFVDSHDYDVRKTGNGRWIDQKCAFDTVCFVADCIVDYLHAGGKQPFDSPTIWHRDYSIHNVQKLFGKPDPTISTTKDEYNKFFRQPLKLLSSAGVLTEQKAGNRIEFSIANQDVLEYIALRERNALDFICIYIEKVLKDSCLWDGFASFFDAQTTDWHDEAKDRFKRFCYQYTPIQGKDEPGRIFNKVLNQLAFKYKKRGTSKGRISSNVITLQDIVYNKTNWYDNLTGKDKHIARGDFDQAKSVDETYDYQVSRAIRNMKYFIDHNYDGESEVRDRFSIGHKASAIHHIFPRNKYPQLAMYYENLIALTAAQHMQEAHPGGNTRIVDRTFQYTCLIAKTDNIRRNLLQMDHAPVFYSFEDFMQVLDEGLETDYFRHLPYGDFESVVKGIEINYQ